MTSDDCPEGFICQAWICRYNGPYKEACASSEDCPPYMFCFEHCCYPCEEGLQDPKCAGPYTACVSDGDCPSGFTCNYGSCWPGNAPDAIVPSLSNIWDTSYYFDMSEPFEGMDVDHILDTLERILNYCELTGIGFVDDLLCDLMPYYIAPHYFGLVDIFKSLPVILSELRAFGRSGMIHICPQQIVSASGGWEVIRIRYPNLCCYCMSDPNMTCNPYVRPDYPACAEIDIAVEEIDRFNEVFVVELFTGKVDVEQGDGAMTYTFAFDPRKVQVEYSRFVSYLLDELVRICTGMDDLDHALDNLVDCDGVQDLVDDLLGGWAPDVRQACENYQPSAGSLLRGLIDQIGVGYKIIKFDGWATVTTAYDPPYGTNLGNSRFEETDDGHLEGECTVVLSGNVPGAWYWER
jgi:hypothetical protein